MACADQEEMERPSRAELRRRKLIETARALFVEHGFHATGIAQIARGSGIAVGQIYRDFASKEEIVAALVEDDCAEFLQAEALIAAIGEGDAARVRAWLHDFIEPDDDLEGHRLFAEIVAESARNDRIARIFATLQDRMREHLQAALALLAPGDDLAADRSVLGDAISTMSLGMLHQRLMSPTLALSPVIALFQTMIDERVTEMNDRPQANKPCPERRRAAERSPRHPIRSRPAAAAG